jgi:chromosomal replication initiation ATPase DnaA
MPAHDRPFVVGDRVPLEVIDAAVCARLGPARIAGNSQPAAFNRQIAMYLAKHVGGWSTTRIGKFYNGRDHSTVCHSIRRIESMREANPELDVQLSAISNELRTHMPAVQEEHPEPCGG